ncbi:MAG: AI-2E family transporter [Methylobacterium sp.]|nr:AI-2E family transporter [Methylobacterium sp.]
MGNLGMVLVNFLLVAVLAAILYLHGETAGQAVIRFARRLSGARGEASAILAAQAVRAVAMVIVLTALVQTMVGWLGLLLAGIPYIGLLTVTMFILALAQLGAGLVILCSALWLFWSGAPGWGIFMIVWSIIVGGLDNVLRPMLIKRGADLPLLLIFAGVIGGLLTLGIIGLFIGPLVLAVTYTLVAGWIEDGEAGAGAATATDQAPDA